MLQTNHRIFPLYILAIAALALYAWRLHVQKERQMAAYEQQYQTLLAAYNHLDQGISYHLDQIQMYSDAYRMPELEAQRMQGEYVAQAAKALSDFSHKEIYQALKPGTYIEEWLPRVQRRILPDSAATAFFQQDQDFADSLRLFSRQYEQELAAFEPFFSKERRAAAEHILAGNRPDQKAMLLTASLVRQAAAANRSLAFLHNRLADGRPSRLPQTMPIPVLEGTCHRAGETIRGEVAAHICPVHTENVTYWVNGKPLSRVPGPSKYSAVFGYAGPQHLSIKADLYNPLTGEVKPFTKTTTILVCE